MRPGRRHDIVEELCAAIEQDRRGYLGIAELAGVSHVTLWFWLRGKTRSPMVETMAKVAAVLGRRLVWADDDWALERGNSTYDKKDNQLVVGRSRAMRHVAWGR